MWSDEMSEKQLSLEDIRRLERGEVEEETARDTVRRLLAVDVEAARIAAERWPSPAAGNGNGSKNEELAGILEQHRRLQSAAETAEDLFRELTRLPVDRQRLMVCKDARFHSWSLCELLLERSWESGFDDPMQALELAEIAVSVAYELGTETVPEALLFDLKARAWAYLGNARRISSDLRGAEKAFELAESLIDKGTGDPVEHGRILELQASLGMNLQKLGDAESLLLRAGALYRRAGAGHRRGRTLISRGLLAGRSDRTDEAVELLRRGLEDIDSEREPRLRLVGIHNLCFYLNELGEQDEALRLLGDARRLHRSFSNRLDLIRLRWLEGRVALAAGRIEDAEKAFSEVRDQFVEHEIGYDAALVSLDLAGVYARQGRASEMRQLAEQMIPIFKSRDLGREVMAAWIVFQNATRMESASVSLIDELSNLLEASRSEGSQGPMDP
jgi:tetratricopeptide (TPR) repeat protein